jgi:radical SAM protein with 4Fe4S-binding SPASM domain
VIFVEPANHCNIGCRACTATRKKIYGDRFGFMDLGMFADLVGEVERTAVLVALYWLGEPLLHKRIIETVALLSKKRIGSTVGTNGMGLNQEVGAGLAEAGLDYLKIAISGMSPETQTIYHRRSDIERIKTNIECLMKTLDRKGKRMVVMIDYLHFPHNTAEVEAAREFFGRFDVHFNLRPGISTEEPPVQGGEAAPSPQPVKTDCDWLWGISAVNWEGRVFPCCHYEPLEFGGELGNLSRDGFNRIVSGSRMMKLREAHLAGTRAGIAYCKNCYYKDIDFQ